MRYFRGAKGDHPLYVFDCVPSGLSKLKSRDVTLSRFGDSHGSHQATVAIAKTAHPKVSFDKSLALGGRKVVRNPLQKILSFGQDFGMFKLGQFAKQFFLFG